jgi:hypothetical protein
MCNSSKQYDRGTAVWVTDPFYEKKTAQANGPTTVGNSRPFLILSDDAHPFDRTQFIGALMTLQQHPDAWALNDSDWLTQSPNQTSYVSPWVVMTPDWTDVEGDDADPNQRDAMLGEIDPATVDAIARSVPQYIGMTL